LHPEPATWKACVQPGEHGLEVGKHRFPVARRGGFELELSVLKGVFVQLGFRPRQLGPRVDESSAKLGEGRAISKRFVKAG
jgi:hypothetical protein